jgi:hypothetical protein
MSSARCNPLVDKVTVKFPGLAASCSWHDAASRDLAVPNEVGDPSLRATESISYVLAANLIEWRWIKVVCNSPQISSEGRDHRDHRRACTKDSKPISGVFRNPLAKEPSEMLCLLC